MDHRTPLKMHTVLALGGICCRVEAEVGRGSNALVYRGSYPDALNPDQRHQVLIKELFPLEPRGRIHRDSDGALVVEPEAEDFWQTHLQSFEAGNGVHLELLSDAPEAVGANLNSCRCNGTLYTILGFSGGRSLQEELTVRRPDLRQCVLRMMGILDALEVFHAKGWLHLDISPDNIMLTGQSDRERVFLIDYNSTRRIGAVDWGWLSCKEGYSPPELAVGDTTCLGIPSDIYSAASVFFRLLMGRKLTISETLQSKAPDGRESPLLAGASESVRSMVARILRKGLDTLPSRRYSGTARMRDAFGELLDRIDSVGVTHWALWESGKRAAWELIRINPALGYLKHGLYPIRLEGEESFGLEKYLERVLSSGGRSGLILARGGMGKTTLLLHTALNRESRYRPASPAVLYISLNGWDGTDSYIRRRILMRLKFKPEENTFESAMHALHRLLSRGIRTGAGEVPGVLLLLDGLNETRGDNAALLREIRELNTMAGVRILVTSRTEMPIPELETVKLMPLTAEDVGKALGRSGLLIPDSEEMARLLRTPMMLSIYIRAGSGGKQPDIRTEGELMRAYLDALLEKELDSLPEGSSCRWQMDAALNYVLPAIAARTRRTGQGLAERQLLEVAESCRKVLRSRILGRVFPRWIGHSRDIFGTARNAEEWLGRMVHELLWQRLGMLLKDSEGRIRVCHQHLESWLAAEEKEIAGRISQARVHFAVRVGAVVVPAVLALSLLLGPRIQKWMEESRISCYDAAQTETVIDQVSVCYGIYGNNLLQLQQLLELLEEEHTESFLTRCDRAGEQLAQQSLLTQQGERYIAGIEEFCLSGDQVAWSGLAFSGEDAKMLITEAAARQEIYLESLPLLKFWASSPRAQSFCPDFPGAFGALLEADAQVMSKLYYRSCYPHLEGAEPVWQNAVRELLAPVPGYASEPEENLESLRSRQRSAMEDFSAMLSLMRELYRAETE